MACSAMRYPLLKNPAVRHYSVAAAAQCCPATTNLKKLNNKVTAVALDNNAPVTQLSIIFKASSRNETYDTQGIAHMIRVCTGLSTSRSSGFAITRNLQQLGGDLSVNADRESISYTLKITRDKLGDSLKYFEDLATKQQFRPWEIMDEIPRLRYEVSAVPSNVRAIELLYKAAFREGLGYSLYCPKRHIGKIDSESLNHFVANYYTGSRCVVVGSGVSMCDLESFGGCLDVSSNDSNGDKPSKYYGGELRKERNSELATVALAVEGGSLQNCKDAIAFAILQKVAGEGPKVKYGACNSPLHKALSSAGEPFAATAFNASHSDSGLFGVLLSAPSSAAGKLTQAAANWLRSPNFSDKDVARGKAALKASVLSAADNDSMLHENMGHQALFSGCVSNITSIVDDIDKISTSDVQKLASCVAKGKLSIAAIGNISKVPYLDQL